MCMYVCMYVVLKFIKVMCVCGVPADKAVLDVWQTIVDENIPHTEEEIRVGVVCRNGCGICIKMCCYYRKLQCQHSLDFV